MLYSSYRSNVLDVLEKVRPSEDMIREVQEKHPQALYSLVEESDPEKAQFLKDLIFQEMISKQLDTEEESPCREMPVPNQLHIIDLSSQSSVCQPDAALAEQPLPQHLQSSTSSIDN